jgi:photoactive yellow protein
MSDLPHFDDPGLAAAIERLGKDEIDLLPFGVIGLDPQDIVRFYSQSEARLSGYGERKAHGQRFFVDVAPCMDNGHFRGKIDRARRMGLLDIEFSFIGDFSDRDRELHVRVQSAQDGGVWIFMKRA